MNKLTEEQKQMIKELKDVDYFAVETDPVVNELVNAFIKEAVPNLFPHYVDNDENAGQKLRVQLDSLLQKEREAGKREGIEMLEGAKLPYEHYWPRAKQEQRLCETCNEVVERYTPCKASKHYPCWQALNSVIEKLKSVEKSNSLQEKLEIDDFKFERTIK